MSDAVEKYSIHVEDEVLDDLKRRLEATRFPDQIPDTGWDYGAELTFVQQIVGYWRDKYDWRAAEAELNVLDHFRTRIDAQQIHFVHARSRHEGAFPLILSHGWPGSIVEFLDVIGPLVDPEAHGGRAEDAFHVVCPSLPGYGFSEPTRSRGWNARRIAAAFAELMSRLGYARYGAQGGDWGAIIGTEQALLDAEHVAGLHLNMPIAIPTPSDPPTEEERAVLAALAEWEAVETGYSRIQATKPQTLGYALHDSPVGLLAWIAEKFRAWTDCDGVIENAVSRDELLTNVTLYWVTGTAPSSGRLYREMRKSDAFGPQPRLETPLGFAAFPKEVVRAPRAWLEPSYNIVHWTDMPRGGHFAALEQPELLVEDLRACFRRWR